MIKTVIGWAGGEQVPPATLNPPVNVAANATSPGSILITWTPPVKADASGYRVYHVDNDRVFAGYVDWGFQHITVLTDDAGGQLQPNAVYKFVVVTTNGGSAESVNSNVAEATMPPAAETGIGLTVADTQTATGLVFTSPSEVATAPGNGLLLANPKTNLGYRFTDPDGDLPAPIPVVAPTLLALDTTGSTTLLATWKDNQINPADFFNIYCVETISGTPAPWSPASVGGLQSSSNLTNLSPNTDYTVTITAWVGSDESAPSNALTATTDEQIIIDPDPPVTTPFTRTASFESTAVGASAQGVDAFPSALALTIGVNTAYPQITPGDGPTSFPSGTKGARIKILEGTTGSGDYGAVFPWGTNPFPIMDGGYIHHRFYQWIPNYFNWRPEFNPSGTGGSKGSWRLRCMQMPVGATTPKSTDKNIGFVEMVVENNGLRFRAEGGWVPGTDLPVFAKGRWEVWEVGLKASFNADGYHRVWRDGVLVINQDNLITLPYSRCYYGLMQIYTFFDGLDTGGSPQTQEFWMDKFYTTSDTLPNTYSPGIPWIGL